MGTCSPQINPNRIQSSHQSHSQSLALPTFESSKSRSIHARSSRVHVSQKRISWINWSLILTKTNDEMADDTVNNIQWNGHCQVQQ